MSAEWVERKTLYQTPKKMGPHNRTAELGGSNGSSHENVNTLPAVWSVGEEESILQKAISLEPKPTLTWNLLIRSSGGKFYFPKDIDVHSEELGACLSFRTNSCIVENAIKNYDANVRKAWADYEWESGKGKFGKLARGLTEARQQFNEMKYRLYADAAIHERGCILLPGRFGKFEAKANSLSLTLEITEGQKEAIGDVVELGKRMMEDGRDYLANWEEVDMVAKANRLGVWFRDLLPQYHNSNNGNLKQNGKS